MRTHAFSEVQLVHALCLNNAVVAVPVLTFYETFEVTASFGCDIDKKRTPWNHA